jgi:dipeptidyl aminopeptidase/acylaminoacyl peptidase
MRLLSLFFVVFFSLYVNAATIEVNDFKYAGPFTVRRPVMMDSLDINNKPFDSKVVLDYFIELNQVWEGKDIKTESLPKQTKDLQVHLIGFRFNNEKFVKVDVIPKGMMNYHLFIDGKKGEGKGVELSPAVHEVVIKYVTDDKEQLPMWGVNINCPDSTVIAVQRNGEKRDYQLTDVLHCWKYTKADISPRGDFMITSANIYQSDGKSISKTLVSLLDSKQEIDLKPGATWMPKSNRYYYIRSVGENRTLVAVNPIDHQEEILAEHIPDGNFTMSPTEDYLIFSKVVAGPKKDKDVYLVVEPDDRQPNWRNKIALQIYDLKTKLLQPLTFGNHSTRLLDISQKGDRILVYKTRKRMEQRPTTVSSLYVIDRFSYMVDTLFEDEGFFSDAAFSPDAKQLVITASPEAFGGIGNVVPAGRIPSMYDYQLYVMDVKSRQIRPMTRDFNPSVENVQWSKADGMIYFTADDKDCVCLFQLNPISGAIRKVMVPEDVVGRFDCAAQAEKILCYGQSASNSDRLYLIDTKKMKTSLIEDLSKETLKNIQLGDCKPWNYLNDRGDTICCRFYLPPHFDSAKQYPMIVNYYGGCSPTSRNFESRYPHHAYAAKGYVVLVVNPSGAAGFGQEFSSRHVNTAGEGVAQDIIGATTSFINEHHFVNSKRIGCIGASYGGFMTQYLQTQTDIFAAAISHAGISDHTSYWGEGYWGYSYSEVSMANSYPWTDKHLYVDQSPLFNADKINTPILFLHGTDDTNVPVGESIQMYTALKLLGKPTAMVLVDGQDHHITDYNKRIKWQNTIFAWFARYLKDDPSWWNAIYKEPNL